MTIATTIKKAIADGTPVYAVVGATDLAVEKAREAREQALRTREHLRAQALKAREDYNLETLQSRASSSATKVAGQVQAAPDVARERGVELADKAQHSYEELAARGSALVKRIREQQSTQDLVAQAGSTVALSKGALTSVRRAAADIERSAKATLTIGRREAASTVESVAESVSEEVETAADTAAEEVTESAKRTRSAAKRTATTARKRTATARTSAKAAGTSARKTTKKASTATKKAAEKIGD